MDGAFLELVGKYGILTTIGLFVASKTVTALFRDRTAIADANAQTASINARIDIIEMLSKRVTWLEEAQLRADAALEEERTKRVEAEDLVDRLTRRVSALEAQIRGLGHVPL